MKTNNQDEETPLHTAAHFGLAELVAFYVEHGAIVDSVNAHMETPLAIATYWALRFKEQEYSRDRSSANSFSSIHRARVFASAYPYFQGSQQTLRPVFTPSLAEPTDPGGENLHATRFIRN